MFYILLIICNLKRQTVDCKVRLQPLSRNLLKFKLLQFKSTYCIYTLRSEYNFFFQCSLIESRICQKHPLYALQAQLNANIQQFENNLCFAEFLFVFGSREPKIASSCKNSIAQLHAANFILDLRVLKLGQQLCCCNTQKNIKI